MDGNLYLKTILYCNKLNHKVFGTDAISSTNFTVRPAKSDSDAMLCLQLLSKTLTCTHHLI